MYWKMEEPTKKEKMLIKRLGKGSAFFAFLCAIKKDLFTEEFQREMIETYSRNRESNVPPAMLAMVWLLQAYTQASDREAIEATIFDLRWQLVLGTLQEEEPPFGQGTLSRFRTRLIENDLDQRIVDRTIELARETGLFGWKNLKGALDSSPLRGAGRVEDTWNLIGRSIANLVNALVKVTDFEKVALIDKLDLQILTGKSFKSALDIDWDDTVAKEEALQRLINDAFRLRDWVLKTPTIDHENPLIKTAIDDLNRVIEQDTEPDPTTSRRKLLKGTAPDRMPSLGDKEMRHGRKSKANKFTGYKRHFGLIEDCNLVAGAIALPANIPEQKATKPLLSALSRHGDVVILDIDRGYLGSKEIPILHEKGVLIRCKSWPTPNQNRFSKQDFQIDLKQNQVTCPSGNTVQILSQKHGKRAHFSFKLCSSCSLQSQCTKSKHGRRIQIHEQEQFLQILRERQNTPEGRASLRERVSVEHSLARLQQKQGSRARYKGIRKNTMDLRRYAVLNNLFEIKRYEEKQRQAA